MRARLTRRAVSGRSSRGRLYRLKMALSSKGKGSKMDKWKYQ